MSVREILILNIAKVHVEHAVLKSEGNYKKGMIQTFCGDELHYKGSQNILLGRVRNDTKIISQNVSWLRTLETGAPSSMYDVRCPNCFPKKDKEQE